MSAEVDQNLRTLMRIQGEPLRRLPARADEMMSSYAHTDPINFAKCQYWRALSGILRRKALSMLAFHYRPIRVAVIGGVNEPAHNQLCFFNYFALMRNWGIVEWRSFLDTRATLDELATYDLVIFSRVRSAHGLTLMRALNTRNVRTLYMLDDNWFWLGREWQEYAAYFTPGKPDYENFLACVRLADATLTYSKPLAEDLRPYAKRLFQLPTNVDMRVFPNPARKNTHTNTRTTIGYVGSLRKNMMAFDALVEIARQREDVSLFVMSNSLPPEFAALPPPRIHFEPYQFNYEGYAATVTAAAPDVLVAPVGRSRFEESKCPNKFLEISASGAAGVYTRAEPYLSHVTEGNTGLFADDNVASWIKAINSLVDDKALRSRIVSNARSRVSAQYTTEAVLPQFVEMLVDLLDKNTGA